jgi:hypothetical protein
MNPWVPIHDAADVLARSIKTLRTWVARGHVRAQRDHDGNHLVHWLDARAADKTRHRRDVA